MERISTAVLVVVLIAISLLTGYYWGLGSGIIEGYDKACNNYTVKEWKEVR